MKKWIGQFALVAALLCKNMEVCLSSMFLRAVDEASSFSCELIYTHQIHHTRENPIFSQDIQVQCAGVIILDRQSRSAV